MRLLNIAMLVALVPGLAACNQQPPGIPGQAVRPDPGQSKTDQPASGAQPVDVKNLLRQLSDFYRQKQSFQVDYEQQLAMDFNGMKNAMESRAKLTVERPNRIAIRQKDPQLGADIICDGEQFSISIAPLKQYSQSPAPKSFDELLRNPLVMGGVGGRGPILDVFSSDPYKTLMEGVSSTTYEGREKIGDVNAHHVKFVQDQFDWELWIAADGQPRVVQAKFDMSKSLAAGGFDNEQLKNAKLTVAQQYKNWQFDVPPPGDAFTFEPPDGAKKVDNFMAGGPEGDADESSELIGKPAPDVEHELLDGGHFSLKELKDKKIVILDFWATWCTPCVREMPMVTKVAEEYRDKDVALYCVNQREGADKIREFLTQEKLNVTVTLDSTGAASAAYGIHSIPMLVLIDKAGIVQSVHVGFSPNIGERIKAELDAILAGKDLAAEAERARETAAADAAAAGFEEVWSKPGAYAGIAVAADGKTIVALNRQTADFLDTSGNPSRSMKLTVGNGPVHCARLTGKDPGELLLGGTWAAALVAVDSEGAKLWEPPRGQGFDDVCATDLDKDGKDEVIVGYNGRTGLHVFGGDGAERWDVTSFGNVWHVTAGDLDGDGSPEVVCTSAAGKVHLFDGQGKSLGELDPGIYAHMVRAFRLPGESADSLLVIGGEEQMVAMDGKGKRLWEAPTPGSGKFCNWLEVAPGATWAAGCTGETIWVIDVRSGKSVGVLPKQGMLSQGAWTTADSEPLLIVATGRGLTAWHIKPNADVAP